MTRWLQQLNSAQREAVATTEGPLLVLAGAGSGKTRVITHRIAHLLSSGVRPEEILAVTFTNKAAEEMRCRLATMVGSRSASELCLSTFHAFGLQLLKREHGKRHGFVIFDTADQIACLREIGRRMALEKSFDLGAILARISAWKNAFVAPGETAASEDLYDQAAGAYYPAYVEQMQAYAAYDFDDLVCAPVQLLQGCDQRRQRWRARLRYVLVDEYQDTNGAQLQLLRQLVPEGGNVCVVGDNDQSIYGWRGADVGNILNFEQHFRGARVVRLLENYRSTPQILRVANAILEGSTGRRYKKSLEATRDAGDEVRLLVAPDGDAEATWVAQRVRQVLHSGRYQPSEVAVLYRSNIVSRSLEQTLREEGVACRVVGTTAYYERKEVKDLIAYLRVCAHRSDDVSLRRVINTPSRGIGPKTVLRLAAWAEERRCSMFKALLSAERVFAPGDRALRPLREFVALIERSSRRFFDSSDLAGALECLVKEIDLPAELERSSPSSKVFERRLSNVQALVRSLRRYADRRQDPRLSDYLQRMSLDNRDTDDGAQEQCVTLCTLHAAKGLEFPFVVLVGVEEGLIPHDRTTNPQVHDLPTADLDEERRLLYVGVTRAQDELVLTRAAERISRGKVKPCQPSRFLQEVEPLLQAEDLSAEPAIEDVRSLMDSLRAKLA